MDCSLACTTDFSSGHSSGPGYPDRRCQHNQTAGLDEFPGAAASSRETMVPIGRTWPFVAMLVEMTLCESRSTRGNHERNADRNQGMFRGGQMAAGCGATAARDDVCPHQSLPWHSRGYGRFRRIIKEKKGLLEIMLFAEMKIYTDSTVVHHRRC